MAQEIIPDKQSVLTCLKQKVYYVDFYQREYVWTKNTVEVLLNDIFYAFEISYKEHKDEEMSQEVLEKYNWYYLNVFITNKVEGKVFIVDGQQRLSTLTLIATKLYHITKMIISGISFVIASLRKISLKAMSLYRSRQEKKCDAMYP